MTWTIRTFFNMQTRAAGGEALPSHTTTVMPASWCSPTNPHIRMSCDAIVAGGAITIFGLLSWLIPEFIAPIGVDGVPTGIVTDPAKLPYYLFVVGGKAA